MFEHINSGQLTIYLVFLISLVGWFFVKRMKTFVFSFIIFEIGMLVIIGSLTLLDNPWGSIGYAIIGMIIVGVAFVTTIITLVIFLFKKIRS